MIGRQQLTICHSCVNGASGDCSEGELSCRNCSKQLTIYHSFVNSVSCDCSEGELSGTAGRN